MSLTQASKRASSARAPSAYKKNRASPTLSLTNLGPMDRYRTIICFRLDARGGGGGTLPLVPRSQACASFPFCLRRNRHGTDAYSAPSRPARRRAIHDIVASFFQPRHNRSPDLKKKCAQSLFMYLPPVFANTLTRYIFYHLLKITAFDETFTRQKRVSPKGEDLLLIDLPVSVYL